MRFIYLLLFSLSFSINAQCIYEYEKEINNSNKYEFEEIDFLNKKDNIKLSGTLIFPKKEYDKLVIIVPGSGKDTRNSHFLLTQNYLDNGIAVYRFDERGIGKSKGKYDYKATTLASDLEYCYQHLRNDKKLSSKKIGVLGHSLGGLASIISYENGCNYDFMILLGTPVEKDGAFIKYQAKCNTDGFYTIEGKTPKEVIDFVGKLIEIVIKNKNDKTIKKEAKILMKQMGFNKGRYLVINPLQMELIRLNHEETFRTFEKPMLYLIGSEDKIVSSKEETEVLESFGNKMIQNAIIKNTNHWLSPKISPSKMERELYLMNEEAINTIINWTLELK